MRALPVPIPTGGLIRPGDEDTQGDTKHTCAKRKGHVNTQNAAICKPRREASEET